MKKILVLLSLFCFSLSVFAYEYTPKNVNSNPFGNSKQTINTSKQTVNIPTKQTKQEIPEGMREIKTLNEYFRYLPAEVHRHWTPYKAEKDYEVGVRFTVHRNGAISNVQIVSTNYPAANRSVLDAVKSGAPYQPLPKSYSQDSVKAQIILEYHNKK